ncbi:hypothetical protein [Janibacter indicus]
MDSTGHQPACPPEQQRKSTNHAGVIRTWLAVIQTVAILIRTWHDM